jgi:hypothetical protein
MKENNNNGNRDGKCNSEGNEKKKKVDTKKKEVITRCLCHT